jgi:hypothetical protein
VNVAEIKAAVSNLTLEERAEVARALHHWTDDAWDEKIKQDVAAGKLDKLLHEIDNDIAKGNLSGLP